MGVSGIYDIRPNRALTVCVPVSIVFLFRISQIFPKDAPNLYCISIVSFPDLPNCGPSVFVPPKRFKVHASVDYQVFKGLNHPTREK